MKDDFSQEVTASFDNDKSEDSQSAVDESLDWAKQAYLQLKQKQREEKESRQKEINHQVFRNRTYIFTYLYIN